MLELRTLFISSTLAAEAGIFSRAETAKQNQKLEFGLTEVHRFFGQNILVRTIPRNQKLD
jgi:hypothetical protein